MSCCTEETEESLLALAKTEYSQILVKETDYLLKQLDKSNRFKGK